MWEVVGLDASVVWLDAHELEPARHCIRGTLCCRLGQRLTQCTNRFFCIRFFCGEAECWRLTVRSIGRKDNAIIANNDRVAIFNHRLRRRGRARLLLGPVKMAGAS